MSNELSTPIPSADISAAPVVESINWKGEISQCLICDKPLGRDSRDEEWPFCHEHRICDKCNLPLTSGKECRTTARLMQSHGDEIIPRHARCHAGIKPIVGQSFAMIPQAEVDFFNLCRLMILPSTDLLEETNVSNAMLAQKRAFVTMTLEQKYQHISMLENLAAAGCLLLYSEPEHRAKSDKERDAKKVKQAKDTRDTNVASTPAVKYRKTLAGKAIEALEKIYAISNPTTALGDAMKKTFDSNVAQGLKPIIAYNAVVEGTLGSYKLERAQVEELCRKFGITKE